MVDNPNFRTDYKRWGDFLTIAIPSVTLALAAWIGKTEIFKFILAYIIVNTICFILKSTLFAPRPRQLIGDSIRWKISVEEGNSFPSGHTASAMAGAVYGVFLYWPVGIVLLLLAFLCAWTRVKTLAHYWRDVFFGSICAQLGCGIVFWNLFNVSGWIH
jgi:membrane-associated phospholipid phosphatase